MPTIVEIPNVGEVEFPDGMTDNDIAAAAQKLANPKPWYSGAGAFVDAYRRNAEMMKADPNSAFGQSLRENEAADRPLISLPRAPQAESTLGQVASGIYNGAIAPALETMTSPNGIKAIPVAAAGRAASAVLAPVMGINAVQQGGETIKQAGNPDATLQQIVEPAAGAVSSALMAAGAGRHAISQPKTPTTNVTGRENTTTPSFLVESNQEAPNGIPATDEPIQDVPRVPDMRGERSAGGAGLPSHKPQGEGIGVESEGEARQGTLPEGASEVRDLVRELPPEAPRGETQAPTQSPVRTIETVGEGQLFRNDEIPFNLSGEVDVSAAEAAAAAEVKAAQEAAAAQDAAQTKMFEEPAANLQRSQHPTDLLPRQEIAAKIKADAPFLTDREANAQAHRLVADSIASGVSWINDAYGINHEVGSAPIGKNGATGLGLNQRNGRIEVDHGLSPIAAKWVGLHEAAHTVFPRISTLDLPPEINASLKGEFAPKELGIGGTAKGIHERLSSAFATWAMRQLHPEYANILPEIPEPVSAFFESQKKTTVVEKTEPTTPVVDQKPAEVSDKPAGDPLMDALDADLQKARTAGDKAKARTLAALKVNYLLGKPPALNKVEKAYGEKAAQPMLAEGKQRTKIAKGEFETAEDVFSQDPVIKSVIENGGIMSKSKARSILGKEEFEKVKSFYDALETSQIQKEHYKFIYPDPKKTGVRPLSPDKMAQILWDNGLLTKGHPDELVEYIANTSTKMAKNQFKSHDQHMEEAAAYHEQQAETAGLHLSADEMALGDTLRLPAESGGGVAEVTNVDADGNVTIALPKGKTVVLPSGHSLSVAEHIRSEDRAAGADEPF